MPPDPVPTEHQGPPEEPTAAEERDRPQEPTAADELSVRDEPAPPGAAPRRRGRTVPLVAAAAALGLIAGACAGVLVQAGREPTKLPPLSQGELVRGEDDPPKPLTAAEDRRVRTEGDLRDLLLKKPRGAEKADWLEGSDGWMDLPAYTSLYTDPRGMFEHLLRSEFRRAAITGWEADGGYFVEIRLVQYRQEEVLGAAEAYEGRQLSVREEGAEDWEIPGTGSGRVFVHSRPLDRRGPVALYTAEAYARRGDIAMEIGVSGTRRIDKEVIMDLAERQLERL
ncbi:hypothetical protein [Streptomyces sp. NPDC047725]|uniref:hypothetical protein n=1 Tax=Streptomyces sp. NPDC047725 TaxID=3365487 RepID=UPI003723D594